MQALRLALPVKYRGILGLLPAGSELGNLETKEAQDRLSGELSSILQLECYGCSIVSEARLTKTRAVAS
jgi:hypothetical protein